MFVKKLPSFCHCLHNVLLVKLLPQMFPYHVPSQLNGDDVVKEGENVTEKPYEFNKELLCVGCARELKPDALQGGIFW